MPAQPGPRASRAGRDNTHPGTAGGTGATGRQANSIGHTDLARG